MDSESTDKQQRAIHVCQLAFTLLQLRVNRFKFKIKVSV